MAFLVHNLPPIEVYVKKEYLYDLQKGYGELTPGVWISVKSVMGKALYFIDHGLVEVIKDFGTDDERAARRRSVRRRRPSLAAVPDLWFRPSAPRPSPRPLAAPSGSAVGQHTPHTGPPAPPLGRSAC